ncbi:MAG TPA: ABC transporter permease subunit [Candidatus Udaeobacter sp.]|nr:ABC transporter permease subunit [Candidatus Udaeobacter sp.]
MRPTLAIAWREFRSYFVSPVAYILISIFLFLTGYFFYSSLIEFVNQAVKAQQQSGMFGNDTAPMNVNEWVVRPFFYNVAIISLFLVPMITMRLLCEEKKTGTIELLLTSPITELEITIGKFLAGFGLYALMLAGTVVFMLILFQHGNPDLGPIVTGYAGLLLLGAASLALGTFVSSLTENPIVAGFAGFALLLLLWLLHWGAESATGSTQAILNYLSVVRHFEDPAKGVIDTRNLVFYVSLMVFGLFATMRSIEAVRWKA